MLKAEGGRRLLQLERRYKSTTIGLDKYLQETEDTLIHFVKDYDDRKCLYSISRQSMKFSRELGVPAIPPVEDEASTTYARRTKAKAKHQGQRLRSKWESKGLHGKYPQRVKQADVDQNKTHRWLKAPGLCFIIAAQDQSLPTRCYQDTSSRSLTWTHHVDCVAVSTKTLTIWSLAALNWLKMNTSTATTRQLRACTGRSAKSLSLR